MTLPDQHDINTMPEKKVEKKEKSMPVETRLQKVLLRAKHGERIVSGVYECASYLEASADNVMLCLLPGTSPNDFAMNFQHKLIEAFCLENDILVLKINNVEKLYTLLEEKSPSQKTANDNPVTTPSMDCSCLLVNWPPKMDKNKHENKLIEETWHNQLIEFPV
ncbi:Growth arrest and DNA damage-inducible protein GADD45 alpha [Mactra antiquata]